MKNLQLPFGVQDYMPQECYNKNLVQERLAEVFLRHGFKRVGTPAIEFYDTYEDILSRTAVNKTFRMSDSDGSLLMLRFDPTLQICRMAATKLDAERIEKVYYLENSYEYISDPSTARSREFPQAGMELLGTSGTAGDVEAIVTAIECLQNAGLTDFLLEIGQVDYFNGIVCEAGMSEENARELRALINKKDMLGVEMFLHGKSVNEKFVTQFLQLPTLFGDEDVLDRARTGVVNKKSLRALDNLGEIMSALKDMGLDSYVSVDLGLLRGEYYTGLVMKGFSGRLGVPILDGGRYDDLCAAFGKPMPAVGFSVGVKRLLMALEKEDKLVRGA
ncbi:MAG: ATP phosphoribosyltransferase regulatory subunit, partial [Clostridiales bacterium]|nr:ATP phosphoribosyltransferase regulatory subunit [Clostridiales bacterium]